MRVFAAAGAKRGRQREHAGNDERHLREGLSDDDLGRAAEVRKELNSIIGADVTTIKPGSPEAEALKKTIQNRTCKQPRSM